MVFVKTTEAVGEKVMCRGSDSGFLVIDKIGDCNKEVGKT